MGRVITDPSICLTYTCEMCGGSPSKITVFKIKDVVTDEQIKRVPYLTAWCYVKKENESYRADRTFLISKCLICGHEKEHLPYFEECRSERKEQIEKRNEPEDVYIL